MSRTPRILFNVVTGVSLLFALPLAVLLPASYLGAVPLLSNHRFVPPRVLSMEGGDLRYGRTTWYSNGIEGVGVHDIPFSANGLILLAVAAVLPLGRFLFFIAPRVKARIEHYLAPTPGICDRCGYDLRATPARCPECGREAGDATS